ncbi:MAG: hypothetical protein CFE21_17140 [Bacteroidetes bacterium B1(2017)]|nr:MAG: hypothetical protein CFE21_17140 [Bacteroidetes bacterium B1(2017)]
MNPFAKIRHLENMHILLWLIKDSCWLMEWKLAGTIAFFPTIAMAVFICYHTRKNYLTLLVNLSVLCWISANSCWMFKEFYSFNGQYPALALFGLGLVFIFTYLYQIFVRKANDD